MTDKQNTRERTAEMHAHGMGIHEAWKNKFSMSKADEGYVE